MISHAAILPLLLLLLSLLLLILLLVLPRGWLHLASQLIPDLDRDWDRDLFIFAIAVGDSRNDSIGGA